MRVYGPNSTNFNPYKRQIQNEQQQQRKQTYKDELNISQEAQQLQKTNEAEKTRSSRIQQIKKLVDSGEYEINHEQVAQKMINFWSNRS